jgi:hydroxypyruvate reductase 1
MAAETYARMMVEGHKMNLIYCDPHPQKELEDYFMHYSEFLKSQGVPPVTCKRVERVEDLLGAADCVSIHTTLDDSTHHLINKKRLALMKEDAILVSF